MWVQTQAQSTLFPAFILTLEISRRCCFQQGLRMPHDEYPQPRLPGLVFLHATTHTRTLLRSRIASKTHQVFCSDKWKSATTTRLSFESSQISSFRLLFLARIYFLKRQGKSETDTKREHLRRSLRENQSKQLLPFLFCLSVRPSASAQALSSLTPSLTQASKFVEVSCVIFINLFGALDEVLS